MNMRRPRVLLLPSWYPTKNNPIWGSFLREQAVVMEERFEFLVGLVEFRRIGIIEWIWRLLDGRGVKPRAILRETIEPPKSIAVAGFGISLGKVGRLVPYAWLSRIISHYNDFQEKRTYDFLLKNAFIEHDFRPDLVFAMTSIVNGIQAYELAERLGVPSVLVEHVPFVIESVAEDRRERLRHALQNASALLTVSHDKSRQILMGNINCRPIVVGNLVDESIYTLRPPVAGVSFRILIVAAYNFYKDFETFFSAMHRLRQITTKPFEISVVGISPSGRVWFWEEGEEKFNNRLQYFGIQDITTVTARADRSNMVSYYHNADVFVMTSIQEGLPVSVLEAMSCGLPIVSTRCGGVEDIVDDSCGKLFHLQDAEGIAITLSDMIEGRLVFDSELIREKVVQLYGRRAFLKRMSVIFETCLSQQVQKVKSENISHG